MSKGIKSQYDVVLKGGDQLVIPRARRKSPPRLLPSLIVELSHQIANPFRTPIEAGAVKPL
jgi:hypothetical protein